MFNYTPCNFAGIINPLFCILIQQSKLKDNWNLCMMMKRNASLLCLQIFFKRAVFFQATTFPLNYHLNIQHVDERREEMHFRWRVNFCKINLSLGTLSLAAPSCSLQRKWGFYILVRISIENHEKKILDSIRDSNLRSLYYQTSTLPLSYLIWSHLGSNFY